MRAPRAPGRALCALFERRPGRAFQRPTAPGVYSRLRRRMYKSGRKTMRAIARDEPRPHASPYRRISRLRAPLQAPIESNGGKNGIQQTTGAPAVSFHYSLGYDVKLHRPVQNPGEPSGRLEPGGSGGTRPARMHPLPGPRLQPQHRARSHHKIQLNHGLRPRAARACRRARALPRRPRAAAFCRRPGGAMR